MPTTRAESSAAEAWVSAAAGVWPLFEVSAVSTSPTGMIGSVADGAGCGVTGAGAGGDAMAAGATSASAHAPASASSATGFFGVIVVKLPCVDGKPMGCHAKFNPSVIVS